MATSPRDRKRGSTGSAPDGNRGSRNAWGGGAGGGGGGDGSPMPMPGTTGRFLVLLREDGAPGVKALSNLAGVKVASSADFTEGVTAEGLAGAGGIVFEDLKVAVVDAPPDQSAPSWPRTTAASSPSSRSASCTPSATTMLPGLAPPRLLPAKAPSRGAQLEYVRGYRDALINLYDGLTGAAAGEAAAEAAPTFDEDEVTWGLQAIGVPASRYSGRGVRIAVLDTGFDAGHPDFVGRSVTDAVLHRRRGAAGRPRAWHALHRHRARLRPADHPAALRRRLRHRDFRRQGAVERGQRQRRRHPGRHPVGHQPTAARWSRCRSALR